MATTAALNKIAANSPSRQSPSDLEKSIAGALYDLETNIQDMRSVLRPLQFVSAREVSVVKSSMGGGGFTETSSCVCVCLILGFQRLRSVTVKRQLSSWCRFRYCKAFIGFSNG